MAILPRRWLTALSAPRLLLLALFSGLLILVPTYYALRPSPDSASATTLWAPTGVQRGGAVGAGGLIRFEGLSSEDKVAKAVLEGGAIMPRLGNETLKAELGRASWRVLHTMAARFPEQPTMDQREAFKSFMFLWSRLYPCGECALEFQELLRKFPPQTVTRSAASLWLCHVHNQVNLRLGKEEFDCSSVEGLYDCGCKDDPPAGEELTGKRDPLTGLELVGG